MLISDGKNATAGAGESNEPRTLDMRTVAAWASGAIGADLCEKPFRWDQRLFALVLGGGGGGGEGEEEEEVEVTAGEGGVGLGWDALEIQASLKVRTAGGVVCCSGANICRSVVEDNSFCRTQVTP